MCPQRLPFVKPVNRTLQGPEYIEIVEMEVGANATPALMIAGKIVVHDTTDSHIKESGEDAADVIGCIEVKSGKAYSQTHAVAEPINIIIQPGARVVLWLSSGAAGVAPGTQLKPAVSGTVYPASGPQVARSLETVAAATGGRILCLWTNSGDF